MNSRVTHKERGLIKGALRRVFSRSDLRRQALAASLIQHIDPKRPRVTKWSLCPICKVKTPAYLMEIDHKSPVIRITEASADLDANTLVDRIWCEPDNLMAICKSCHKVKSKLESRERTKHKREKKANARR